MIDVWENAPPVETGLDAEQAAALAGSELVKVRAGPRAGRYRLSANGMVGVARVAGLDLRVHPKTPIERLLFLFGYAHDRATWHTEPVDATERPDLLTVIAHAFARAADRALRQGVLLGYREMEEALPVVRGRIRVDEQIRRHYGMPLPVEVRYDDHTIDIAENRLLLAASRRLLRLTGVPQRVRSGLRRVEARLPGVTPPVPGAPPPRWSPDRRNSRYRAALHLAELVLRGASYELDDGRTVRVDGLMLAMAKVFEDFVAAAFGDELCRAGGRCVTQDRSHFLDARRRVETKPDLVWYRTGPDGLDTPAAVLDAKYKTDQPTADVYQMLAYCTAFDLTHGHLIYAAGTAPAVHHDIRGGRIEITAHALNLDQPPEDLLTDVGHIATEIHDEVRTEVR